MKIKISHNWLQSFFKKSIPSPDEVEKGLLLHSFEVESVEKIDADFIYEMDILPSRSIDCLSHYGIAKEISAIFSIPLKRKYFQEKYIFDEKSLHIKTSGCDRYTLLHIKDISLTKTPDNIKKFLNAIGQKSINPIVDISNYLLFSLGQPNHAFDASKVSKNFSVRQAKEGEKIVLIGDDKSKEVSLKREDVIIANDDIPVAIAGVKGGEYSSVDKNTRDIYLEVATFDMSHIRATSRRLGLNTDASIRYSQGYKAEMIDYTVKHIVDIFLEFSTINISYDDCRISLANKRKTGVSLREINKKLGTEYLEKDVSDIFERIGFSYSYINPRNHFVSLVKDQIGVEYKWGSSVSKDAPNSFDCSSLVTWCAANSGKSLPRMSVNQYISTKPTLNPLPGDLIFIPSLDKNLELKTKSVIEDGFPVTPGVIEQGINHLGVVVDDNKYIQAVGNTGENKVIETELTEDIRASALFTKVWEDEKRFVVDIPVERFDINLGVDLIEEVARIGGLKNIISLPPKKGGKFKVNTLYAKQLLIVDILRKIGISEVITYSFLNKGEVCVSYPAAQDKGCLRKNLSSGIEKALEENVYYGELFGLSYIAIFELGTVFIREGDDDVEEIHLCIGVREVLGRKKILTDDFEERIKNVLPMPGGFKNGIWEVKLDDICIESDKYFLPPSFEGIVYKAPSKYPFVLRDISVFVPNDVTEENVKNCIRDSGGEYLRNITLLDIFEKDNKISYTFRTVFQSDTETLSDKNVLVYTDSIYRSLTDKGYIIR